MNRLVGHAHGASGALYVVLLTVGCAAAGEDTVTCRFTDEACIEDARLRGVDLVLVDEAGDPVDPSGNAVEDSTRATISGEEPFWSLEAGDRKVEGRIGFVGRGDGRMTVQLVSRDAVNLVLTMVEADGEELPVEEALLAFGDEPGCALVASDPPFRVRFTSSDERWVAGRYEGILACPDYTTLPVQGAYRIPMLEIP